MKKGKSDKNNNLFRKVLLDLDQEITRKNLEIEQSNNRILAENKKKDFMENRRYTVAKEYLRDPKETTPEAYSHGKPTFPHIQCNFCNFSSRYVVPLRENEICDEAWGKKFSSRSWYVCMYCLNHKKDFITQEQMTKRDEEEDRQRRIEAKKESRKKANKLAKERVKEKDKVKRNEKKTI